MISINLISISEELREVGLINKLLKLELKAIIVPEMNKLSSSHSFSS